MKPRYACPCCGFLTLTLKPPGTYELCPVCFWEDDGLQFEDPNYEGGANQERLAVARTNFREFGASSKNDLPFVRPPLPEERPKTDSYSW